jgi:tetratricopeptide (TPR) repeat protein
VSFEQGLVKFRKADYGTALGLFQRAMRLSPSTPRYSAMEQVCRGHQFLSTRFFDKARECFEGALQTLPGCREAQEGLDALAKLPARYFTTRRGK